MSLQPPVPKTTLFKFVTILQNPQLLGFQSPSPPSPNAPPAFKMMAAPYCIQRSSELSQDGGYLSQRCTGATSSSPIRYLGFPLLTSVKQRNSFLDQLTDKIRLGCQIHKQRALSVRGCATALNSPVLSQLWYVLCVVTVPVDTLDSIQSVISQFINFRISPQIGYLTLFSSRSQGGLGILNPKLQQGALQ
ncbi:hypothetical protein MUCCIDRAFT_107714 [Mucor lusitanicus CBS 277.49]|uniref:Uncharacterized protein n=1 Tax=Mucor lusitanicus CBS 277.49 TaxID=747725 RepID=A0A168P3F4_MUCCL|nr:hypothetical protein MUCCIDRAFT_107714 [Mucor lusitanicus CBS 277.49]